MSRENIISGGLEGDGIEGHKRKKREMSRGSGDKNDEGADPFDTGFGSSKPKKKTASDSAVNEKKDIFETDFGSSKSKGKYRGGSSIGSSSDIFSNGFGSEDAGWMSGRRRKSHEKAPLQAPGEKREPEPASDSGSGVTGDIFETGIASHPLETDEREADSSSGGKKKAKGEDPFYTGFGYTDQRVQKSEPAKTAGKKRRDNEDASEKTEENTITDEDDLFS